MTGSWGAPGAPATGRGPLVVVPALDPAVGACAMTGRVRPTAPKAAPTPACRKRRRPNSPSQRFMSPPRGSGRAREGHGFDRDVRLARDGRGGVERAREQEAFEEHG